MDTRTKIADPEPGPESTAAVVTGYFDPLLAVQAQRIAAFAALHGPVTVLLADPEQPLLPARARAELAAGLRATERVVMAGTPAQVEAWLVRLSPRAVLRLEQDELVASGKLVARILDRHPVTVQA